MSEEGVKSEKVAQSPTTGSVVMEPAGAIDPVIHKRTMLKLDTVVLGCFGVMYLLANLDRNNLVSRLLYTQLLHGLPD
jgi:hypothetical protein